MKYLSFFERRDKERILTLLTEQCDRYTGYYQNVIGEIVQARELIIHPNFRQKHQPYYKSNTYNGFAFDYCLARVDTINFDRINEGAAEGVTRVAVANFPTSHVPFNVGIDGEVEANITCTISGWGKTGTWSSSASVIRDTKVDVMSKAFCNNVANTVMGHSRRDNGTRAIYSRVNGHYSFCAGLENGSGNSRKFNAIISIIFQYLWP